MDAIDSTATQAETPITHGLRSKPISYSLPDKPIVTIQATKLASPIRIRELWVYRELLYFLIWRDLKVRYKQTLLGVTWVVLQPLLMTVIFTVFLGLLARVPSARVPYPLLVYSGLLLWTFFSSAVSGCGYSLTGNANLITKVYFPRVLVPAAYVGARLVDFAVSFVILGALILFYQYVLHYRITPTWRLVVLPLVFVLITLFSLALGTLVAGLHVKYRDVGVVLPVMIQLWMFVSPVVYPLEVVPHKYRMWYFLNPMAGLIEGFRSAIFGLPLEVFGLVVSIIATILLLAGAAFIFRRIESSFADLV